MGLGQAHEGYEYQDLLTVYYILEEIIQENNSIILIDKKEFETDKFDDLTIQNQHGVFRKQIKYSNNTQSHHLERSDISSNSYDLAIDSLFSSWYKSKSDIKEIRLCLSWDEPLGELLTVLDQLDGYKSFANYETRVYKINIGRLWPENEGPLPSWKRFKKNSQHISRSDFNDFCKVLMIETNLPKFSLDIYLPGELEIIVLNQINKIGIGKFPNNHISQQEFLSALILSVKKARSKQLDISIKDIFHKFQIHTDFGAIDQIFPVDYSKNINTHQTVLDIINTLNQEKKVILTGEPGSGKSWFIQNLIEELDKQNIKSIKHYCYTDLVDKLQKERIKTDVLYGNLISELLKYYPYLKDDKELIYASNLSELNLLLSNIIEPIVLIIDGIDHINRIFNYRNYMDITFEQINIIDTINKINCCDNVKLLIVSQPVAEIKAIVGFKEVSIPRWSKTEVLDLMQKYNLSDQDIENQGLSDLLLRKSAGNPLYLTFLIEEIRKINYLDLSKFNSLPEYSYNLEKYYEYILSKINTREVVPQILAGVNFSLTKTELYEMTGLGEYLEELLDLLSPILRLNTASGGYSIYHESFRRFIFENIKKKKVNINQVICEPVIRWFETKDFYEYPKSYYYFLEFLFEGEYFDKVSVLISKTFIQDSISHGYSWDAIKNNYSYFVMAATEKKDIEKVIILNELKKILITAKDTYEASFFVYLQSLGSCFGFEKVSSYLAFEGEPTLPLDKGIKACYLCDDYNSPAPWYLYKEYFKSDIDFDDFKYFIRYHLVSKNNDVLKVISKDISESIKFYKYKEIYQTELHKYSDQDYVKRIIEEDQYIKDIFNLTNSIKDEKEDLKGLLDIILNFDYISENDVGQLYHFIKQINIQIDDQQLLDYIEKKLESRNWFCNWLIYYIKICKAKNKEKQEDSLIREAFEYLIISKNPFEGSPRACDLYNIEKFIYTTIKEGLLLIVDEEEWGYILHILKELSSNTTTTLQKSQNGPLTTENLFKICLEVLNDKNVDSIIKILEEAFYEASRDDLHSYLVNYCFELSIIFSFKKHIQKSKYYYQLGINYILSYGTHRDIAVEDIIESIDNINNDLANKYILELKSLVDAIVDHTDGKDTQHFPVEWFKKFYKIDTYKSYLYVMNQRVKFRINWKLDESLKFLLENTNGSINPLVELLIHQLFLLDNNDYTILYLLENSERLKEIYPIDICNSLINNKYIISKHLNYFSEDLIRKLSKRNFIDINSKRTRSIQKINSPAIAKQRISRDEFSKMETNRLIKYFQENKVSKNDVQSLVYVFSEIQNLNSEAKQLIQALVRNNEDKIIIDNIFENQTDVSTFYWITKYVYQVGGWYENFVNQEALKVAYNSNPEKSIEFLYEYIADKLININHYDSLFSGNLINSFAGMNYSPNIITNAWLAMYEILKNRLPVIEEYDWESFLENKLDLNVEEIYICIFIAQIKTYTVQRFHMVLSGLSFLLFNDYKKMVKPFKWFFTKVKEFKDSVILAILELIHEYNKVNPEFVKCIRPELDSLYPMNYYMIDYILEDLLCLQKTRTIVIQPETFGPDQDYEEFLIDFDYRLRLLTYAGYDLRNLTGKFKATYFNKFKKDLQLYSNIRYKHMVDNIYLSDYILEIINKDLYNDFRVFNQEDLYNDIKIDIRSLIAQNQSLSIRPTDIIKPSEFEQTTYASTDIALNNGWVRIAHFETEFVEQNNELHEIKSFGGMVFEKENSFVFPYSDEHLSMDSLWGNNSSNYKKDKVIIYAFIQGGCQLENYKLLWLNPSIVKKLDLFIGDFNKGLYAVNKDGEIIIKYHSWIEGYFSLGSDFRFTDEIPKLSGSELLIKEEYFRDLCKMFRNKPTYCSIGTQHFRQ